MANLDTTYKKYFDSDVTIMNAVQEAAISNLHIIGTENYNQAGTFVVNTSITLPLLGEYNLSKDITRHIAKIERDIVSCFNYFITEGDTTLSYNKLNLSNGDTLTDAHIIHIEDGIFEVGEKIEDVQASLTNMDNVKASLVAVLKTKGFVNANTDMSFDELITLVSQI